MNRSAGFVIEDGILKAYTRDDTCIVVPDEVTEIGCSTFKHCKNLAEINITDSVVSIEDGTF